MPATLTLPAPINARIEALSASLLSAPGRPDFDFARPPGVPALVPADSESWRLFKNPVALFIGGVTAVLLELGESHVRDGVWQHSSFRTDPLERLRRTGLAAMVTVYGAKPQAEAMIAGVVRAHGRVTGTTGEGEPYHANDPALLAWVQATASYGFIEATHAYVRPLDRRTRDRLYAEAQPSARLYGAVDAPASQADLDALFATMLPRLAPHPIVDEFLAIIERTPVLPRLARPLQRLFVKAAVELLPPPVRARLRLGARWSLARWERRVVTLAARAADRLPIRSAPAVQACRRLGLPDDYLYR